MLGDEEALGDLVRRQVLVEQEEDLDLARGEDAGDRLGDTVEPAAVAHAVEQPAGDASRERRITPHDTAQERRDLLRRLRLQQVAGRPRPDRRQEVLLGIGGREDDDLGGGRLLANAGERGEPVHAGHRQVEEDEVRLQPRGLDDRPISAVGVADDVEALLGEQRRERVARQRMVVDDENALGHVSLIGTSLHADKGMVDPRRSESYRAWVIGEAMLVGLLASATALFAVSETLQPSYALPEARVAIDSAVTVVAVIVSVLASVRFLVEGRALDLLLAGGFWCIALGTVAFGLIPVLGGEALPPHAAWALVAARLLGAALIAAAPYTTRQLDQRRGWLMLVGIALVAILGIAATVLGGAASNADAAVSPVEGSSVVLVAALLAALWLVALIGFGLRYRRHGRDLDSWICLAATLALFADLHLVLTPVVSSVYVLQGDFLRLVAYGILLVGVWRAIAEAEFGRAVADERARVAREIHDGLAQYLFAISTQVNMLESNAPLEQVLPRLKSAATAAQQEARFAVLALSSAGGSARFDFALRRYVEVLTADGALEVEMEIDPRVRLAPDEQIEVFRIVQEGLGNARRHAQAGRVQVAIRQANGRRVVSVRDDGVGFDGATAPTGHGLANMTRRAEQIGGVLELLSAPGRGTSVEVLLRAT